MKWVLRSGLWDVSALIFLAVDRRNGGSIGHAYVYKLRIRVSKLHTNARFFAYNPDREAVGLKHTGKSGDERSAMSMEMHWVLATHARRYAYAWFPAAPWFRR